jgi:hypothetical protein
MKSSKIAGFAPIIIIVVVALLALVAGGAFIARNQIIITREETISPDTSSIRKSDFDSLLDNTNGKDEKEQSPEKRSKITSPTKTPTPILTSIPTSTPKPTTSESTPTSCNYDLVSSTGAVKVNIQAQSGILVGDQTVELQAQSGCKVLANKSTDKDTRIARQGNPSVNFSSVPPGSFSVRVRYKDLWTNYQNISVNSGQQTTTTITVSGDTPTNTPTPTPKPKPTCYNPIVYPSSTGNAPYSVTLQPQGMGGAAGYMVAYEWDFTGDGSWDATGSLDAQNYTYSSPGTYTVKMRVLASNGEYSDVCQTTVTVQ